MRDTADFINQTKEGMKKTKFKNEYGEEFVIYSNGITVFFEGDETDWELIPLFNSKFNIWNEGELHKLGKALMELHK